MNCEDLLKVILDFTNYYVRIIGNRYEVVLSSDNETLYTCSSLKELIYWLTLDLHNNLDDFWL